MTVLWTRLPLPLLKAPTDWNTFSLPPVLLTLQEST